MSDWDSSSNVVGPLPEELWSLTYLTNLNLGQNYLTGTLSPFVGNLTRLQYLALGINALSGELPRELGKLTDLRSLAVSTNNFSGPLPSDLGNCMMQEEIWMDSSGLSGAIPSLFARLQQMKIMFASDTTLTGRIPDFIGSWSNLTSLDVSYNELSGSFPSWADQRDLQLNLVANNFTIADTNSSVLASGLNCLQRNFPCSRGDPRYSSFGIKCGGQQMRSAAGILHEADNETLSPAAYYVTKEQRWAVSNVGLPSGSQNPEYKTSFIQYIPNARDPEMFQSSRVSAGSLRYYGLGLQNGGYNVTLQFVEAKIENPTVWKSLGRRKFDIYIQGNLEFKDFDIQKEAGGSFRAVAKDFTARVTDNHLEIHLFWAGKGTCCVPAQGTYGPSISTISVTPADFIPTVNNEPPNEATTKKNRTGMIVGIVVSIGAVIFLSLIAICYSVQRRKQETRHEGEGEGEEFMGMEAKPYIFSYAELRAATDDFSTVNKLGEGGFGPVYKGTLEDGRIVAVKQLSVASHQGKSQFVAEIEIISAVQHRNLVKLYGCCIEGEKRLLVYEYLENKSLDLALFGKGSLCLDWATRFDICLGAARGLAYLHEESRLRIIHRDVKASNILLDSRLNPKISDFGLAKLYDDKKTHMSTRVAGTMGYLAPEYAMRGHLTEKVDVFGFGVVALEVISGRANADSSQGEDRTYLLEWAWHCHENNRELDMVDHNLSEYNKAEVRRVIGVALLCSQTSPVARPSMSRAVAMLLGDASIPIVISKPGYLTEWNFSDISTFEMQSDIPSSGADQSNYNSSFTPSRHSPIFVSEPMLQEVIEGGG